MLNEIAFIGLGSNMDSPEQQIIQALNMLHQSPNISVERASHLYSSQPMGQMQQPSYVNAVCKIATSLQPLELLDRLQEIEAQQGRVRSASRWASRTLDLDILTYNQLSMDEPRLTIPHYGMREREFVLVPMFEIEPDMIMHDGKTLALWINQCDLNGLRRLPNSVNFESIAA